MNRRVFVTHGCGCGSPSITGALERAEFEKAATAQARKGRRRPALTTVGRYVSKHEGPLTRKLTKILRKHARTVSRRIANSYEDRIGKLYKMTSEELTREVLRILNSTAMAEEVVGTLKQDQIDAFKRAGRFGITQVGINEQAAVDQVDAEAAFWAANRGGELIKDLAGTTDDDMRELLNRAVEDGMSADDLASEIEDLGAFGEVRASMIARTELAFAHVQGNVEGWRATGEVEGKRWILGDLHEVEDECDDAADAGVVDLEAEFGDTGVDFPPAHPNCWCDVIPVLKEAPELTGDEGDSE